MFLGVWGCLYLMHPHKADSSRHASRCVDQRFIHAVMGWMDLWQIHFATLAFRHTFLSPHSGH